MASIPSHYGEDRLVLMIKNPSWLHTYWEITQSLREKHEGQLVLRTYGFTPDPYFFDTEIFSDQGSWYIDVSRPDTEFYTAIGVIQNRDFIILLKSNRVRTPPVTVSEKMDENWLSLQEIYLQSIHRERGPA